MLLHIVDASSLDISEKIATVLDTIRSLELQDKPMVTVFNKIDLCNPDEIEGLKRQYDGIALSALKRATFDELLEKLETNLFPAVMEERCRL